MGNGLFVLTLDSRNNGPSEIIPTWNLMNDLHDSCVKSFGKLHRFGSPKSNAHALRFVVSEIS